MLKRFIEQLSIDLGFEQALEANDDGTYSLRFEPDIDIILSENLNSCITLYTRVAELPSENTESYLLKAMIGNLFGNETGGSILGLDNEAKRVVLLHFLPEELNYDAFHDHLEDFVNYADVWRQETMEFIEQQDEGK